VVQLNFQARLASNSAVILALIVHYVLVADSFTIRQTEQRATVTFQQWRR